jgi:hypothetical protein
MDLHREGYSHGVNPLQPTRRQAPGKIKQRDNRDKNRGYRVSVLLPE